MSTDKLTLKEKFANFSAKDVLNSVEESAISREERMAGAGGNWKTIAYPQAGNSIIRFFMDSTGKIQRPFRAFTLRDPFIRVMDPRFFPKVDGKRVDMNGKEIPENVISEITRLTKDVPWNSGVVSRFGVLMYGSVYSTDAPKEKSWEAAKNGTSPEIVLMVGNGKIEEAVEAQLVTSVNNSNILGDIRTSLDPFSDGWAWNMALVGGTQGSCGLSLTYQQNYPAPVPPTEDDYLPLDEQFVSNEYVPEDVERVIERLVQFRLENGLDDIDESSITDTSPSPSLSPSPSPSNGNGNGNGNINPNPNPNPNPSLGTNSVPDNPNVDPSRPANAVAGSEGQQPAQQPQSNEGVKSASQFLDG